MSQELFYTSAPRGLQPGSRGFCTVAATRGMSAALLEKLESLSGYRPLFPPHDARARMNPVAFAHIRISAGGKTCTVVSRIGPAGLDYTERPNKFAHHVVLDAAELPAAGPAWLLRQPGFLEARWDGQVQVLTTGRTAPRGDAGPEVCRGWQALTGDAGWGGVLAEAFQADPARLVYLVFEPGMDLLPLLAESLALLPPEQRWEVTLSTYFTGLPQGAQCLWRCVPRGSPEAKGARQFPNALILDVGDELGAARGGALVARARGQVAASALEENGAVNRYGSWERVGHTPALQRAVGKETHDPWSSRPTGVAPEKSFGETSPTGAPPPPVPPTFPPKARTGMGWPMGAVLGLGIGLGVGVLLTLGFDNFGMNPGSVQSNEDSKPAKENVRGQEVVRIQAGPANNVVEEKRGKELIRQLTEFLKTTDKVLGRVDELLIFSVKEIAASLKKALDKSLAQAKKIHGPPKPGNDLGKDIQELANLIKRSPDWAKLPDDQKVGIRDRWERLDSELYAWIAKLEETRNRYTQKTIRDYGKLPRGTSGDDALIPLAKDMKNLGPTDGWKLLLVGYNKDRQDFKNRRLLIFKEGKEPLAQFRLEGATLIFKWDDVSDKANDMRSLVRNSILEIEVKGEKRFLGLNRLETDSKIPHKFSLTQRAVQLLVLDRHRDDIPEKVYFYSAVCELGGQIRVLRAFPDENKLRWGSQVILQIKKKDDEPAKYQIVANWIGDEKSKADLVLHAFVAYTKVGNHRVEVWRVGEKLNTGNGK